VATGEDESTTLNAMIDMANDVFERNPRNVKQFVNILRLQAFIASETGLFEDPAVMRATGALLTVPQLAKFVALCMRWPDFVEAAIRDESLVGAVEGALAPKTQGQQTTTPDAATKWLNDRHLAALLRFQADDPQFLLKYVNFQLLTMVAPVKEKQNETVVSAPQAPSSSPVESRSVESLTESERQYRAAK
jgi:hypothetical protein